MRRVVPTAEVYHLWSNESQEDARNANDSASFSGELAYSYRTPIGRIVRNARGERAYLVTSRTYSVTTSGKHMPALRRALPSSARVFHVPTVARGGMNHEDFNASDVALHYAADIAATRLRAKRARVNRDWQLERASELMQEARHFCTFFDVAQQFDDATLARLERDAKEERARQTAEQKEERARRDAALAAQEARRLAEYADLLPMWREGARDYLPNTATPQPIALRLSRSGEDVETSRGARVPVDVARRLWSRWMSGAALERGERIGAYRLDCASSDTLVIGCHTIAREEASRFATSQGWGN